MGLLIRAPQAATFAENTGWLADWLRGGTETDSGISIGPGNALQISTVWKCVRARAETFGMLPKKVFERVEMFGHPARQEAPKHPLYRLVHAEPNPLMSAMQFFEAESQDLDLWGNFYAYVERGAETGRLRGLWRLRPDMVRIEQSRGGGLVYVVRDQSGHEERFAADEILHVRGLGFDGVQGYSIIRLMMNNLGWNRAATRYGAQFFKKASRPSGMVTTASPLTTDRKKELLANLSAAGKEAGRTILVEGAADYKQFTIPQDEAQFIETIQFQEEDIAGQFRVPPHKIGILRRATNNNIEHQSIEWVTDSIQPICERTEQAFAMQLLSDLPSSGRGGATEKERFFMKCILAGLMRGDTAARTAYYRERFNLGSLSQNDIRAKEDEEPIEGGDDYWIQLNMTTIENAKKLQTMPNQDGTAPNEQDVANRVVSELQARFESAYHDVYSDAIRRVMARRAEDRERSTPVIFRNLLAGLAKGLEATPSGAFSEDYLAAMGKRSAGWTDADATATEELNRAIRALTERK